MSKSGTPSAIGSAGFLFRHLPRSAMYSGYLSEFLRCRALGTPHSISIFQFSAAWKVKPRPRGFFLQAVTSSFGEVLLSGTVVPCLTHPPIKVEPHDGLPN